LSVELAALHAATKNIINLKAPHWWLAHGGASSPTSWGTPLGYSRASR